MMSNENRFIICCNRFKVFVELPASIGDDVEPTLGVHLGEDGSEATCGIVVPERSVGDESVLPICPGIGQDRLGA